MELTSEQVIQKMKDELITKKIIDLTYYLCINLESFQTLTLVMGENKVFDLVIEKLRIVSNEINKTIL